MSHASKTYDEVWRNIRQSRLIVFIIQEFLCGIEYSVTFLTTWFYVKSVVSNKVLEKVLYTIISSCYLLMTILTTFIYHRYLRKNVKLRYTYTLINISAIVGNVLFTFNFAPAILVIGRFIAGSAGGLVPIAFGEISQSDEVHQVKSNIMLLAGSFEIGSLLGPLINFAFRNIDWCVGDWHLTYVNVPSLFLSFLFVCMTVIVLTFLHDLPDTRQSLKNKDTKPCYVAMHTREISAQCKNITRYELFQKGYIDVVLIMLLSSFEMFCLIKSYIWFPLLFVEADHYTIREMSLVYVLAAAIGLVLLVILCWREVTLLMSFILINVSLLSIIALEYLSVLLKFGHFQSTMFVMAWILYALIIAVVVILQNIISASVLTQMASSEKCSAVNGTRITLSRAGALLALLTAVALYTVMEYVALTVSIVCSIFLFILFIRRKEFLSPRIIIA